MALARPRREQEKQAGTAARRDGVALVGIEAEELTGARVGGLVARVDSDGPFDDEEEGGFFHLVVA